MKSKALISRAAHGGTRTRRASWVTVLMVLSTAGSFAQDDEPAPEVPDEVVQRQFQAWRNFPVFAWMHPKGPKHDQAALNVLRTNGFGVNVEGMAPSLPAALVEVPFYVGHLSGKGDLHMRRAMLDAERARLKDEGSRAVRIRPVDLLSRDVLARLEKNIDAGIRAHAVHRPLAYSLEDEISVTFFNAPFDYDFQPTMLRLMGVWLQEQYTDLDHLNEVWGSSFDTIKSVKPELTETTRAKNARANLEEMNFAPWADHRAFMESFFADYVGRLIQRAQAADPGVPVGFLGGQAPSAFGGYDWALLARTGTYFEAYDPGMAPQLVRDFASPETRIVSTLTLRDDGRVDDDTTVRLYKHAARGDDGAIVWSSAEMFEDGSLQLTPGAENLAKQVGKVRAGRRLLRGARRAPPEVLIYVSQPSIRGTWMLDSWNDGDTWVNRLTSYENEHSASIRSREAWARVLGELCVPYRFVDSRDFLAIGGAEFPGKVLVLNQSVALSDREVHELIRFAAAGGLLIADADTALFDERLRGRDSRALTAMLGVQRKTDVALARFCEFHNGTSGEQDTVRYLGLRRSEKFIEAAGQQARSVELGYTRALGLGNTLFMNLDLADYPSLSQRQPGRARAFREALAQLLGDSGNVQLFPRIGYGDATQSVSMTRYGTAKRGFLVIHGLSSPAIDHEFTIEFDRRVQVVDPETNRGLGAGRQIELNLIANQFRVVKYTEVR